MLNLFVGLSVCLFVSRITQKVMDTISMKFLEEKFGLGARNSHLDFGGDLDPYSGNLVTFLTLQDGALPVRRRRFLHRQQDLL